MDKVTDSNAASQPQCQADPADITPDHDAGAALATACDMIQPGLSADLRWSSHAAAGVGAPEALPRDTRPAS